MSQDTSFGEKKKKNTDFYSGVPLYVNQILKIYTGWGIHVNPWLIHVNV